ncbi:hypothetical protein PR048_008513 [Dryococelus australis]|uniref:Uncharacterized protein n=1 Tax=Dryococelus australis TaxID=614101 RepID=A0ABQ9HXC6_9NEOP|nr:hypothetical protein PR048_008513 [Dryococelus australis]
MMDGCDVNGWLAGWLDGKKRKDKQSKHCYGGPSTISLYAGATVAERLACSPPTKAIWAQSPAGYSGLSHVGIVPDNAVGWLPLYYNDNVNDVTKLVSAWCLSGFWTSGYIPVNMVVTRVPRSAGFEMLWLTWKMTGVLTTQG